MNLLPPPLPAGVRLHDRYEIVDVLGRGGFGIVYRCEDRVRGDHVVVKELAPSGTPRDASGLLQLDHNGESAAMLRERFRQEALILRRVRSLGIPHLRDTFHENGTTYAVTEYLPGSETLAQRLTRERRLSAEAAREILVSMLDILERVHAAGVLHRDIKPSNILLGRLGEVVLIDFGAARDYATTTQTVMYTPGYAPPEQLSERAHRGPATDLYGLAAAVYHALTGEPPATVHERVAGHPLRPILEVRRDLDPPFAAVIERALSLRFGDRPQSVAEMRQLLAEDVPPEVELDINTLDARLAAARSLRFDRHGCPACSGVLIEPRPLRRGACPVCREGQVVARDLDGNLCPVCRAGELQTIDLHRQLAVCPSCSLGRIRMRRVGLHREAQCDRCERVYTLDRGAWRRDDGETKSLEEWQASSGRAPCVRVCDQCEAQFDQRPDRRWAQVLPLPDDPMPMYAEEWARVAAGLDPGAGNAECRDCRADYWQDLHRLTLIDAPIDPYGYVAEYLGRAVPREDTRWLGVGKTSGHAGRICDQCGTEFDLDGVQLRLVQTRDRTLARQTGETHAIADWHRLAKGLPVLGEEDEYVERIEALLREAYRAGTLPFDTHADVDWRGMALRDDGQEAVLTIDTEWVQFGGMLRRWRRSRAELDVVGVENDVLVLTFGTESVGFEVAPVDLAVDLKSGSYTLPLDAEDLVARLSE